MAACFRRVSSRLGICVRRGQGKVVIVDDCRSTIRTISRTFISGDVAGTRPQRIGGKAGHRLGFSRRRLTSCQQDDPPRRRPYHAPGPVPTIGHLMRQKMGNGFSAAIRDAVITARWRRRRSRSSSGSNIPFDQVQEMARYDPRRLHHGAAFCRQGRRLGAISGGNAKWSALTVRPRKENFRRKGAELRAARSLVDRGAVMVDDVADGMRDLFCRAVALVIGAVAR
jgi:hypothetical protein